MAVTRRALIACGCCAGAVTLGRRARAAAQTDVGQPQSLELGTAPMQRIAATVWVARIAPGVWLHTTTTPIDGAYFPANGLVLERPTGSILIDTGYRPDQAAALLAWSHGLARPITSAVATHFHGDRVGGIPALQAAGVRCVAHPMTWALARRHGLPEPEPIKTFIWNQFKMGNDLELYAPGPAHTRDNVVAWLPGPDILFGGCMVKSTTSADLGYVADAVPEDWPASVTRLRTQYPTAKRVIPGHGTIAGDPIAATLALLGKT